jgi:hypothetical protein
MRALVCPSCRALLEPALPLCVACARVFPEEEEEVRALAVRQLPDDPEGVVEVRQLLAAATGQDEAALARYLGRGGALFRVPVSELVAERLVDFLGQAGAQVELAETVNGDAERGAWARTVLAERRVPAALLVLCGVAAHAASGLGMFVAWMAVGGGLVALEARSFHRRVTLSPAVLARRLGLMSGAVTRPAAALLRRARSRALREALGVVMIEHARLLAAVANLLRRHPPLQAPFRETLDQVGAHTLRIAENAVAIEEASDADGEDLPARLANLRALGSEETDRQLRALLTSRDERHARQLWLRRTHALLLIRLEVISERLRALRQDTAHQAITATAADPAATEQALGALGREMELASSALHEVERDLPQALPEVIAEVLLPAPASR